MATVGHSQNVCICTIAPPTVSRFEVSKQNYAVMNIEVVLDWDPPSGPDVVDNYTIYVLPMPVSHPISNVVNSTSWNVTLDYNVIYNVTITSRNCAGESEPVVLANIHYGKNTLHQWASQLVIFVESNAHSSAVLIRYFLVSISVCVTSLGTPFTTNRSIEQKSFTLIINNWVRVLLSMPIFWRSVQKLLL